MRYTLHISSKEIDRYAKNILNPIKFGENGIGLCYPGCFIGYTIHAFLDSPALLKKYLGVYYKKYFLIPIELTSQSTQSSVFQETTSYILEKFSHVPASQTKTLSTLIGKLIAKGFEPYFFLLNAHCVDQTTLQVIIDKLYTITTVHPRSGMQVFTEGNIFDANHSFLLTKYHRLLQNISAFPVFSESESEKFVRTLAATWQIKLTDREIQMITKLCGGYLWLLREAVRTIRIGEPISVDSLLNSSRIAERASYIFSLLDTRCKDGLYSLCVDQHTNIPDDVKRFLTTTGLVNEKGNRYIPSCPLFAGHLHTHHEQIKLQIKAKNLYYNEKPINHVFTKKEFEILHKLVACRGSILTRDMIATIVWGDSDTYSDWAVDKIISRIRHTLARIGLPKQTILTKKRQGFLIQ